MRSADTIFALSSGAPPAAIAIIRISGTEAFAAVEHMAGELPLPRNASLRTLRDPESRETLDNALVLLFPGPNSATGENLAELHLHGGRAVVRAVERTLGAIPGLRQAEAGEFTRRAFAHGRMDLNEAEGLADLLSAETEWQRRAATRMMQGSFSAQIETWRSEILKFSAMVEADLDFSDEDDVESAGNPHITDAISIMAQSISTLLDQPPAEKLRDGLRVVLGGPPNSGKSTLLNALVGRDAAIVSEIAGTTRDRIEVPLALGGVPLLLVDTAGVHDESEDQIEQIGIDRARDAFSAADILLWLGPEGEAPIHSYLIEIDAKSDVSNRMGKSEIAISLSAETGTGLSELKSAIVDAARDMLPPADGFAVNARQRALLAACREELSNAVQSIDGLVVAEHLRQARLCFDALTGRAATEDMLDMLFGRFCIGK